MRKFLKNEEGTTTVEYGLIFSLVAVLIIAVLMAIEPKIEQVFGSKPEPAAIGTAGNKFRFPISTTSGALQFAIPQTMVGTAKPLSPAIWLIGKDYYLSAQGTTGKLRILEGSTTQMICETVSERHVRQCYFVGGRLCKHPVDHMNGRHSCTEFPIDQKETP